MQKWNAANKGLHSTFTFISLINIPYATTASLLYLFR